jgi:SOS-response transcriptional repressor LexA
VGSDIEGSPVQQKLLTAILDVWDRDRRIPTYQEIADDHGMVKSGVQTAITKLINKHYPKCERTSSRNVKTGSIRPTTKAWEWQRVSQAGDAHIPEQLLMEESDTRSIRVLGEAAAGGRMLVSEDDGSDMEHLALPAQHVRRSDVFMLTVSGDSMTGDDLYTGDHLIVDPHAQWDDGDMVVVNDQGSVRVKRIWDEGAYIVLESSNAEYEPIKLKKGKEHLGGQIIQGKVIGRVLWHVKAGRRNEQVR